jgi:hypothetical protein
VFFRSEEEARAHRKQSHRIRGVYFRYGQMAEGARLIQSVLFGF